jgi:RHS repeat-associated protein
VGTSATQWFFGDQLGSTRALTDSSAAIVGGYGYSVYGAVTSHTGTASTPLEFAAQYTDAETGYQFLRARYYDPATAQFLTVDPLADRTLSRYGYADENPVQDTDPSGLYTGGLCFQPRRA